MQKRKIAILGSTGSIGTQTLDVIKRHPEEFEARVLTAGRNVELLIKQAREFIPDAVVIADESKYEYLKAELSNLPIKVYSGEEAIEQIVEQDSIDIVVAAMVGFAGLRPTVKALKAGKAIALANKETLVVAGQYMMTLAEEKRVPILPVDSEHSAIFQCLAGENGNEIEKILLTASGGPFRNTNIEELRNVTPEQALNHPNWKMGAKITVDSATMMNKGFEMIEACWLFGVPAERVEVLVHPESTVHSAVQFYDGAVKAQLGIADMRLPIQYALSYPHRLDLNTERLDLFKLKDLHFEKPDEDKFRCLRLAFDAMMSGGDMPCIMNASNEVANLLFRKGCIGFLDIANIVEDTMEIMPNKPAYEFEELFEIDKTARDAASKIAEKYRK